MKCSFQRIDEDIISLLRFLHDEYLMRVPYYSTIPTPPPSFSADCNFWTVTRVTYFGTKLEAELWVKSNIAVTFVTFKTNWLLEFELQTRRLCIQQNLWAQKFIDYGTEKWTAQKYGFWKLLTEPILHLLPQIYVRWYIRKKWAVQFLTKKAAFELVNTTETSLNELKLFCVI